MYVPHTRHHALDGLRAVAILAVLVGHAMPHALPYGHLGVDVFFALSGYLITGILWEQPRLSIGAMATFWRRRFWRLAPALAVMVVAGMAAAWIFMSPLETATAIWTGFGALAWISPLLLPQMGDYFQPEIATNPFLHTWSLGVEAQFYFVFPFLLWGLKDRPRLAMAIFIALILASLAHLWGLQGIASPWAHYSPFGRAWELLAGACLAIWQRMHTHQASVRWAAAALLALMATLMLPALPMLPLVIQMACVACTLVLIRHACDENAVGRALRRRPVQAIGLASYSIYLWHQPVFAFLRLALPDGHLVFLALALPPIALLGALSYRFVERPGARVKASTNTTAAAAFTMAAVGLVAGITAVATHGFESRYTDAPAFAQLFTPTIVHSQGCGTPERAEDGSAKFCRYPAATPERDAHTLAIWGDSFAMALTTGFLDLPERPGILHLGMDGCTGIQLETSWSEPWRECLWRHQNALHRIIHDDTISTVVVFARWETPHIPDGQAHLLSTLHQAITAIKQAGKTVVFAQSVPAFGRDVGSAALRTWRLGHDFIPRQTRTGHAASPTRSHAQAMDVAAQAGARIVPTLDITCPQEDCPATRAATLLYYDEEHLTPTGAAPIAQRILDAIATPSPPEK